MSYATVLSVLGWGLAALAGAMLAPALLAYGLAEGTAASAFVATAVLTAFIGGALIIATRGARPEVGKPEGFLLAVLAWTVLPLFGAIPFLLTGTFDSLTGAYFESLSGLTTTGATLLADVDQAARSVLLWRALLAWIGGLGTILLAVSLLSLHGIGGMHLFRSAIPRGERDALKPRLVEAIRAIWWIYATLTALCTAVLWSVGMPPFDALVNALSALSSAGFTAREGSIGVYDSPLIELVLIVFMTIAALNFSLHWAAFHGRFGSYAGDPECQYFLVLAALGAAAVAALYAWQADADTTLALRTGLFNAVSMLSTTGFTTGNAATWPVSVPVLLLTLALVGGATGSTAGGIKLMRLGLYFKQGGRELARLAHPHGIVRLRYGKQTVAEPVMRAAWSFFVLFMFGFVTVAVALSLFGLDARTALAAAAAALSNTGPALVMGSGGTAHWAAFPDGAKWVICLVMLVGRLELLTVLVLFRATFWRR